ncbi:CDP-alcohol phosphatidyltransferase [Beutenbergia cavernae DSM 12333]|uniref:CDP-alcohol phosphatidyltransferase n=1 Tax=Beutenbergia cavernae (strain ATCC BAA-8 / DSM 12333 / CCUG 43141 / JCM 11478 / NBRC 16432 / NCIMB 13614 / HKI 0122) TaxID=471853 RepID=C5C3S1_BEUC1|nr:CDP-alcohol phosphatidyltransferase family protein [Beutenbergia cavernae]ACQ81980.1 CDP-alcohol phosphatidyltransferase [Beutenbergia cavernae DSM 12333]
MSPARVAAAGTLALGLAAALAVVVLTADDAAAHVRTTAVVLAVMAAAVPASTLLARRPPTVGPADGVTLARAVGAAACAALVVIGLVVIAPASAGAGDDGPTGSSAGATDVRTWVLLGIAAPALALDAVDGVVARRTGTASAAGGRLDVDADAVLLIVLSVAAATVVGSWALVIGLAYPAFLAVGLLRPAWRHALRPDPDRRTIAALQAVALAVVLVPAVPRPVASIVAALASGLLLASFARDAVALDHAHRAGDVAPA